MADRVVVDTGLLIAIERGDLDFADCLPDGTDAALPAIVVAELLVGVRLARTAKQRSARSSFVEPVLARLPVIDYDRRVAAAHADLLAHVRSSGSPRSAHDLIIAATAAATDRIVVTADRKASFDHLPRVQARILPPTP